MRDIFLRLVQSATCAAVIAIAIGGPESFVVAHSRLSQVTWTIDVEPIVKRRCLGCHTTEGFGPMSLATYQDARAWSKAMRREVLERRMPPWPAARGFGDFANDRSLTPIEVELLTAWADGLTPLGPVATESGEAPARHQHDAVQRPPDLVVAPPAPRALTRLVEQIELPTGLTTDRWVTRWEFRPGNRSIVEQAVLKILPSTIVGAWTPPDDAIAYPSGIALRLPAGARLALEVHYRKSATPQTDQSGAAFWFGARPSHELRHRTLACGTSVVDRDADALAVTPRAAEAGASMEIVARDREGGVEPLAVVPRYEPGFPLTYRFRTAVRLRRGATIELRSSAPGCAADLDYVY
jgi:hypothetical protein